MRIARLALFCGLDLIPGAVDLLQVIGLRVAENVGVAAN